MTRIIINNTFYKTVHDSVLTLNEHVAICTFLFSYVLDTPSLDQWHTDINYIRMAFNFVFNFEFRSQIGIPFLWWKTMDFIKI